MATYFITGANRGIGFEFVKQTLAENPSNKVIAASRNHEQLQDLHKANKDRLILLPLDVTSESQIKGISEKLLRNHITEIDYLINNAGFIGKEYSDKEDFHALLDLHVVGPYLLFQELLPLLQKSNKKVVVNISSFAGSIASQTPISQFWKNTGKPGGFYSYRVSKTAENALSAIIASDERYKDLIVISLHPGTVATEMAASTGSTQFTEFGPEKSVEHQLKTIHGLTKDHSGKFLNYSGTELPY